MEKEIKKILHSMDVKQDRDDAQTKAGLISKFGSDAIDILVTMGEHIDKKNLDTDIVKKRLRAIIFTLTCLAKKNDRAMLKKIKSSRSRKLLYKLYNLEYKSAELLLNHLGIYASDIQKELLNSLPVVDGHDHDKEISLNEAIEEIKIGKRFSGFKGVQDDCYIIGSEGKYVYKIYRIAKSLFALRSKKSS